MLFRSLEAKQTQKPQGSPPQTMTWLQRQLGNPDLVCLQLFPVIPNIWHLIPTNQLWLKLAGAERLLPLDGAWCLVTHGPRGPLLLWALESATAGPAGSSRYVCKGRPSLEGGVKANPKSHGYETMSKTGCFVSTLLSPVCLFLFIPTTPWASPITAHLNPDFPGSHPLLTRSLSSQKQPPEGVSEHLSQAPPPPRPRLREEPDEFVTKAG